MPFFTEIGKNPKVCMESQKISIWENKAIKSRIATYIKKYKLAVDNAETENAQKLLSETFSLIDSAVSKGTLQKATANRKKSRLSSYANNK